MNIENLVTMANDIGAFFATEPPHEAASHIHAHFKRYWDPRMRKRILEHYRAGGEGLVASVREAVAMLESG